VFDWIEVEPEGPRIPPTGPGIWKAELLDYLSLYSFTMLQEFRLEGGETLRISIPWLWIPSTQTTEVLLDAAALTPEIMEHRFVVGLRCGS